MNRPRYILLAFGACLTVVLAALGWSSHTVLRLEAAEAEARQSAAIEENVRLALWRMDSALAPLVAQESARPSDAFLTWPIPESPYVLLRFEYGDDGRLISELGDLHAKGSQADDPRLLELARGLDPTALKAVLPEPSQVPPEVPQLVQAIEPGNESDSDLQAINQAPQQTQRTRGANEYQARANYLLSNSAQISQLNNPRGPPQTAPLEGAMVSLMTPHWVGGRLFLARRVGRGGESIVQACWLDWAGLESWLIGLSRDLLPQARLKPVLQPRADEPARLLAALPAGLAPNESPLDGAAVSPVRWSLAVAWICVSLAAGAVFSLLLGVLSLSERRAAFVSAVTHELRTPLTTFRLYTEMLAGQMVTDERQRTHYLETLQVEAERLTHLVENVLTYARLERGRARSQPQDVTIDVLVERVNARLQARAQLAEMQWVVEADEMARAAVARTDVSAVEQILFNLVDNASKYAAAAVDRRIHLRAEVHARQIVLSVSDHGPGIAPRQARRLFHPFSKTAGEAANSAPGVGLGLALCRRLAREMGGDLRYRARPGGGSCFELRLPRSTKNIQPGAPA